jgi:hypothetical protein
MFDPRFVTKGAFRFLITSTPRTTAPLVTARRFATTPRWPTPSMPQGRDFSPLDTVEIVTNTFDFGPWLASTTMIASVSALSCSVYSGTDTNPTSRIVGMPSIVASPATGAASAAVAQQFGNMIAGVTYRLDVTVITTDGQTLNLWSHQVCQAPN